MKALLQDLRYALRQLRKSPGFTLTAILTLAMGIGATTAIFTLAYDALLKPLPYPHPEQLVVMEEQVAEFRDMYPSLPLSANHFDVWQQNLHSFEAMAAMKESSAPLGLGGHPLQVEVVSATPGIFPVLDAAPQIGRAFSPQEAVPGRERVVILMNDLWRTQFQSDPHILGRTVTLNGFPYTVIGVMAPSFHLPFVDTIPVPNSDRARPIEALVPLAFTKDQLSERMGDFNYFGLARLRPGVSIAQAGAELNALQHTISASLSAQEKGTLSASLIPFQRALVGDNRKSLLILLAAVAGLLLVGCVNIANLLLSRAVGRRQQNAVLAALGASRGGMLRAALCETALLAAMGGTLGVLLAGVLVPLMQRYLPPLLNFRGPLHLDWTGAACAVLLAGAATLLAGAVPAWVSSRTDPADVLRGESRQAGESRSSKRLRRILVAVEVAASVALVLMTGLLVTSLVRLMNVNRGFDADRVITAEIDLPSNAYPQLQARAAFYQRVLERLQQLPGADAAGLVSVPPLAGDYWLDMARVQGDARPFMQLPIEHFRFVSPGYFPAIHLPLVSGRYLSESDRGRNVALVSQLTARTLWPGQDPIGRQFTRGGSDEAPFTVIGVVKDARTIALAHADPMIVYMPYWYRCDATSNVVLRTHQDPSAMAEDLRQAVWSVDPNASVPLVRSLGGIAAESVANRRFEMDLLLLFALSALALAGLGIYGVVNYSVVQRRHEIGLRMALGAQRSGIYSLVLRDGLAPVLAGAAMGVAVAFASARLIASLLFEVSPYNPAIAAATIAVLVAVGAAACLLPARRAAAADPMQAIRTE